MDGYENMTYQNLWATTKEVLNRKYVTLSAYIGKVERLKFNYICIHFEKFKNIQQVKPIESRRKEVISIRAEFNKTENKCTGISLVVQWLRLRLPMQ